MKSLKTYLLLVGIGCGAWWSVTSATAAPIIPQSDEIVVNLPGNILGNGTFFISEASPFDSPHDFVTGIIVPPNFNLEAVALTEPNGAVSDLVWVDSNNVLNFASDNEDGTFTLVPPICRTSPGSCLTLIGRLPETGGLQDVGAAFGLGPGNLLVQSDVGETPLPPAWTFMLFGLAVFGFAVATERGQKTVTFAAS
jgi:hypothetical protein